MKKMFLKLSLFVLTLHLSSSLLAQTSCINAVDATSNPLIESQTAQSAWYKFTALTNNIDVEIINHFTSSSEKLNNIILWSGNCSGLTQIADDTLISSSDSVFNINSISSTVGNTYYLEIKKSSESDSSLYEIWITFKTLGCTEPAISCELINNGSFENYSAVPTSVAYQPTPASPGVPYHPGYETIQLACGWINPMGTPYTSPSLFTSASPVAPSLVGSAWVPTNNFGIQYANTGSAYAGFYAYVMHPPQPAYHEYIAQQFPSHLQAGVTYNVSFYVSLTEGSSVSTNAIGAAFVDATAIAINYGNTGLFLDNSGSSTSYQIPQVMYLNAGTPDFITDYTGWTHVTGSFVATGLEEYIVIGNFGNSIGPAGSPPTSPSYYYLDDVSVTSTPSLTVNSEIICSGQSATLTASVADSYSWSTGSTANSITVNPASTISYTVTGSSSTGCSATAIGNVTVNPTPTMTVNSPSICAGQTVVLTANGGTTAGGTGMTYVWSTGFGGNTASVHPITTTSYTVTGTNSFGCSATVIATVTVNPLPIINVNSPTVCSGGTATLTATGATTYNWSTGETINPVFVSPVTTSTYTVTGTSNGCSNTATATVTVNPGCCAFAGGGGIPIIIPPGGATLSSGSINKNYSVYGTITILGAVTLQGCDMQINPGVKIIIPYGSSLTITKSTTRNSHLYACNQMWEGIYVNDGKLNIINNTLIEDALNAVVCTSTSNTSGVITINKSTLNRNLKHVIINQTANTANSSAFQNSSFTCTSNLNPPNASLRTYIGFEIHDAQSISIGVPGTTPSFPNANTNTFSNMDYGIACFSANANIYNNDFNNLSGSVVSNTDPLFDGNPFDFLGRPLGIAVYALGTDLYDYNSSFIKVGQNDKMHKNRMTDCYRGTDITEYGTVKVNGNEMTNSTSTMGTKPGNGNHAVFVKNFKIALLALENNDNTIVNYLNGIHVIKPTPVILTSADILRNDISALSTKYVTNGVYVESYTSADHFNIQDNKIYPAQYCIRATNIGQSFNIIHNPKLLVKYNAGTTYTAAGIRLDGCYAADVRDNRDIYSTATVAQLNPSSGTYGNTKVCGIYATLSPFSLVSCNVTHDVGRGLVFENVMGGTEVITNTIGKSIDGFVLLNNGLIGPQGNATTPNDNNWGNNAGAFYRSQTYTDNTLNANFDSPFYVRNNTSGVIYNPANNHAFPVPTAFIVPNVVLTPSTLQLCPVFHSPVPIKDFTHKVSVDSILFVNDPLENKLQSKQMVYQQLRTDPSLMTGRPEVQTFYNQTQLENTGKLALVNEHIANKDYTSALTDNTAILPEATMETNSQTFNDIFIKTIGMHVPITPGQISDLQTMANGCPLTDGKAVYQSRALLNLIYNDALEYIDNCNSVSSLHSMTTATPENEVNKTFKLFPNPNNGNMLLDYSLNTTEKGEIMIYDIAGKIISNYTLDNSSDQLLISNEQLNNGIYLYHIMVNNKIVKSDKLVIIK